MKKDTIVATVLIFLVGISGTFLAPNTLYANSFFWQGTDIGDSGDQGLINYDYQREIHNALLEALPVTVYGAPDDCGYGGGGAVPENLGRFNFKVHQINV